ncbi:MAG: hypothetical protein ACJ8DZ_05760 [Allosphingosinicella sp.]
MSILLSLLLVQASAAPANTNSPAAIATAEPAQPAAAPVKLETKSCRDMLMSSSRLGAIKVCKTRAQWQRWERCHSATRYCPPPTQNTVTMASLPGDKLICKYLKKTGSRLEQEKICATKRQWELTEMETQETVRDRQNQSKIISGSGQ